MTAQEHTSDKFPRKFGKYHLLGPLAQGGMGALYLAVTGDRGLERLTVIKTVLPHLADKEYVARFRDEAKVVVQLSHGNLIPVFDAGQVEGELYVAMDFVEGKDLRAVWNRCAQKQVAFPIDVAVYIVKELARGLDFAHSFGDLELVHRDVSPPNVLVSYAGEVKLTDFGLASSTMKLEKTAPGIIYGKVAYMSPEQARGEKLDGRSDLYAAAIILWELLTGRQLYPPSKEQPQDLVKRAKDPTVEPPSKRAPRVPAELDAICLKALAPRREDRYSTGEEFRQALAEWLAKAAPATDTNRLAKFTQELFAEDIVTDRKRREALIEKARKRAMTMPPTDELRKLLSEQAREQEALLRSQSQSDGDADDEDVAEGRRRGTIRVGRSAADRRGGGDRRRGNLGGVRRSGDPTDQGVAVDVPKPGPGGSTVVRPETASGALALSERREEDPYELDEDASTGILGQILDGRYHVLELIGEGGMGRVYLAEHVEIGRRVAVKILHQVYSRMPELVERFRREARAASRIGHPHIVDVTDSGTTPDESVYFVMEYLEGVELASVIDREGALRTTRALNIASQICRALAAAHAVGVIHRDLKPENVFLTVREGTSDFVKVLDFGIAKSAEAEEARNQRLTHPGMAMGTPEYMAPEQAAGRPADGRTDVYAVGAILYEMLTGVPPYQGDNFMEILTKKATSDPTPLSEMRPELPDTVVELVDRAMARDPKDRPPSMEALEYELTKALQGRGKAVAKILGMPMDLAGDGDGGMVGAERRARLQSSPVAESGPARRPSDRVITAQPAPSEPVAVAGGGVAAADEEAGLETMSVPPMTEPVHAPRRAASFAWILLGAALVLGIGVVVYVAIGEQSARDEVATQPPTRVVTPPIVPDAAPAPPVVADAATAVAVVADAAAVVPAPAPDAARQPDTTKVVKKPPRDRKGPPRNRREANELLDEARGFEAKLQWHKARENYERVAKGRYKKSRGFLGLAKVAFETKQTDTAITYAERALDAGAGDAARLVLGHAYFKKQQYLKSITYYEAVLESQPNNKEAQRSLREARKRAGQ